jgi:SET domain-containing protein
MTMEDDASGYLLNVEIRTIEDRLHPAYKQKGLFATQTIRKYTILGEYAGRAVLHQPNTASNANSSRYKGILFEDEKSGVAVDIDAKDVGNEFRFLNDCTGTRTAKPNVLFKVAAIGGRYHILVLAIDDIHSGEELLAEYGSTYWEH